MDVSEIVVSKPAANFARLLMKRSASQLVYFNCSMTPNNSVSAGNVLQDQFLVCERCVCVQLNFLTSFLLELLWFKFKLDPP